MKTTKSIYQFTPAAIYAGLLYTTKEINKNFKIKVKGIFNGKKINTLVGVSGLIKLIGVEFVNKFVAKAFKNFYNADKFEFKLRRGLQVSFYCF